MRRLLSRGTGSPLLVALPAGRSRQAPRWRFGRRCPFLFPGCWLQHPAGIATVPTLLPFGVPGGPMSPEPSDDRGSCDLVVGERSFVATKVQRKGGEGGG